MTTETTPPTPPKTKRRPGPKPRKGTDAALALRVLYENEANSEERALIRKIVEEGHSVVLLREIVDEVAKLDEAGYDLATDLFDVVDKRTGA